MTPEQQLARIAELMAKCAPGSTKWKRLQAELDRLCGVEPEPRNPNLEEAWERSRTPGGENE